MKRLALFAFFFTGVPAMASARPYFRVIGGQGYQRQILSELCFSPSASVGTSCNSIPVITHSYRDGYLVIPNEDWALLTVGGAFGQGDPFLAFGPAWNVAPALKAVLLVGLDKVTGPNSFLNLKELLSPPLVGNAPDLTINLGVKLGVKPINGYRDLKGELLLSIGPKLEF